MEQTTSRAHVSLSGNGAAALRSPAIASGQVAAGRVSAETLAIRFLRGREAILAVQPLLVELARSTGQAGEADSLAYFLSTPDALKKTPHLLLFDGAGGEVAAAVLVFEYRAGGLGSRVFSTADGSGRRDVLAPAQLRASIAARAARRLVECGAQIVHLSFSETHRGVGGPCACEAGVPAGFGEAAVAMEFEMAGRLGVQRALFEQDLPAYLPLLGSFDETLARIGQKTRANLRYYRRRGEKELGCSFVASARLSLEDFLAFNRECTYAVPDALATFRYKALGSLPNFCLRGLRDGQGRWLALAGTRRQNQVVELDWQMNRADLPANSLATVLRSYLIEEEIARGSKRLYMEGGTPQPIGNSFVKERVSELTVKRESWYVGLLERFAGWVFPAKNYVGQRIGSAVLRWRRG